METEKYTFEDWLNANPCCEISWDENQLPDGVEDEKHIVRIVSFRHQNKHSNFGCLNCYMVPKRDPIAFINYGKETARKIIDYQLDCFSKIVKMKTREKIWLYRSSLENSTDIELLKKFKISEITNSIDKENQLSLLEGWYHAFSGCVCKAINEHFEWSESASGNVVVLEMDIGNSLVKTAADIQFVKYIEDFKKEKITTVDYHLKNWLKDPEKFDRLIKNIQSLEPDNQRIKSKRAIAIVYELHNRNLLKYTKNDIERARIAIATFGLNTKDTTYVRKESNCLADNQKWINDVFSDKLG